MIRLRRFNYIKIPRSNVSQTQLKQPNFVNLGQIKLKYQYNKNNLNLTSQDDKFNQMILGSSKLFESKNNFIFNPVPLQSISNLIYGLKLRIKFKKDLQLSSWKRFSKILTDIENANFIRQYLISYSTNLNYFAKYYVKVQPFEKILFKNLDLKILQKAALKATKENDEELKLALISIIKHVKSVDAKDKQEKRDIGNLMSLKKLKEVSADAAHQGLNNFENVKRIKGNSISKGELPKYIFGKLSRTETNPETRYFCKSLDNVDNLEELVREIHYRAYYNYTEDHSLALNKIIKEKRVKADRMGFGNILEQKCLGFYCQPNFIDLLLINCYRNILPKFYEEQKFLLEMKNNPRISRSYIKNIVYPWDEIYFSNLQQKNLDKNVPITNVIKGISLLSKAIYNLDLIPIPNTKSEIVSKTSKFRVINNNLNIQIYINWYRPETKIKSIYNEILADYNTSNVHQIQKDKNNLKIVINLNLDKKFDNDCNISYNQAEELFGQFGLALHSTFNQSEYTVLNGLKMPIDVQKIPNNLFKIAFRDVSVARHWNDNKNWAKLHPQNQCNRFANKINEIKLAQLDQHIATGTDLVENYESKVFKYQGVQGSICRLIHHNNYENKIGTLYTDLFGELIAQKIYKKYFKGENFSPDSSQIFVKNFTNFGSGEDFAQMYETLLEEKFSTENLANEIF